MWFLDGLTHNYAGSYEIPSNETKPTDTSKLQYPILHHVLFS